jgi:SAM-dependent methyltransferase
MDLDQVKKTFRSPKRDDYPELASYSREEIYDETIGGGALYLAVRMTRMMKLQPGDIVLDLGCGKGATSIFLVKHFGVRVVAVDWWTSATTLNEKFTARGCRDRITPLHLDITKELPFADNYFDAIFSMNSFSFYGGDNKFLRHLLPHLKPGGQLCIGGEVLSDEFTREQLQNPPRVYAFKLPPPNDHVDVFADDFSRQHIPEWWRNLFDQSGMMQVEDCQFLDDADELYEDLVLFNIEHNLDPDDVAISIEQIEWGRTHTPHKSLFALVARKL